MILDFLEKKEILKIIFCLDAKDQFMPVLEYPGNLKKKAVYFIKPEEMVISWFLIIFYIYYYLRIFLRASI